MAEASSGIPPLQYKGGQVAPEQVQFNGESVCKRDPVSSFPDQPTVHLGQKMAVSFLCKREIVFFTDHKPPDL